LFFLTGEPAAYGPFQTPAGSQAPEVANFSCPAAFSKRVQCKMNRPPVPGKPYDIKVLRVIRGTKRGQKAAPGTGIWPGPFPYYDRSSV